MAAHCYSPTRWSKAARCDSSILAQPAGGRMVQQVPEDGQHSNSESLAIRHVPRIGVARRWRIAS